MPIAQFPGETLSELGRELTLALPSILLAIALVAAGWIAGRLLKALTIRVLGPWTGRVALRFGRVFRSQDVERRIRRTGSDRSISKAVGTLVFWIVFLIFVTAATEALGLHVISAWLAGVGNFLPRILAAVFIVVLGFLAGGVVRAAVTPAAGSAGFAYPEMLGQVARGIILAISVIVAFDQVGLEVTFLIVMAAVVSGSMLGGAALAFGLGARTSVSNILASHYLVKTYQVGHRVRIDDLEGRILEITPTAVIIESSDGRVVVPAKDFSEKVSTLIAG